MIRAAGRSPYAPAMVEGLGNATRGRSDTPRVSWPSGAMGVADNGAPATAALDAAVALACAGDREAFATLFRALHPRLLRFLRAQQRDVADDLAAETWLAVTHGAAEIRGRRRRIPVVGVLDRPPAPRRPSAAAAPPPDGARRPGHDRRRRLRERPRGFGRRPAVRPGAVSHPAAGGACPRPGPVRHCTRRPESVQGATPCQVSCTRDRPRVQSRTGGLPERPLRGVASRSLGLWRSLVSALDWGSRGREFKSPQPDSSHQGERQRAGP
jgi:hypothetical protein